MEFEEWFNEADRICLEICGLGINDIPDGPSWDSWDSGMLPRDYVVTLLEEEGFPF